MRNIKILTLITGLLISSMGFASGQSGGGGPKNTTLLAMGAGGSGEAPGVRREVDFLHSIREFRSFLREKIREPGAPREEIKKCSAFLNVFYLIENVGQGDWTYYLKYMQENGQLTESEVTQEFTNMKRAIETEYNCSIDKILFSGKNGSETATRIDGKICPADAKSLPNLYPAGSISIASKLIIVATGAVESPSLLIRSGHPDPNEALGKGLIIHPSLPIIGLQSKKLVNYRGITGSMYSNHFYESHGFYFECLFGHPIYAAGMIPGFGTPHFELMKQYQQINGFGVMLVDTPVKQNRVVWNRYTKKPEQSKIQSAGTIQQTLSINGRSASRS